MGLTEFRDALSQALENQNQSEIARRTNGLVSQGTISTWKNGNAEPQLDGVRAVEIALDLPVGHLSRHLGWVPLGTEQIVDVVAAIRADTLITDDQRDALRMLYNLFRRQAADAV